MSIRRLTASAAVSVALVLAVAGTAAAHECYIASRSDTGDTQAGTHSKVWGILPLEVVYTVFLPEETGMPALDADQLAWAMAESAAEGIPLSFTIRTDKVIGDGSSNPNLADGRGLNHAVDAYGAQIGAIYFAALGH